MVAAKHCRMAEHSSQSAAEVFRIFVFFRFRAFVIVFIFFATKLTNVKVKKLTCL